jgi:asparagine synthase (glutamine-hydrolysing)
MAQALAHRGPDTESVHEAPGVGLAWRCRHTTGRPDPDGPSSNEDGSVVVVCDGRSFDYPTLRQQLSAHSHQVRTSSDAELMAHLWEDYGEGLFDQLHGQFALALWDSKQRCLLLARDRIGIAPLYWARRGPWLLFGSEIKALLASGLVQPEVDRRGLDHVFTFLGMPAARTCFRDIQMLLPGHYLKVRPGQGTAGTIEERWYWDLEFPDRGQEQRSVNAKQLADQLEHTLLTAVARRLRADVPVASYISGGVDCSTLAALAGKWRQQPIPTFTIRIDSPHLDETSRAQSAARALGSEPIVVSCRSQDLLEAYPRLIRVTEAPVTDCSCASLLLLAERVRAEGYGVALAGDGADDLFAGYPWFKVHRLLGLFDWGQGLRPGQWVRRAYLKLTAPHIPWSRVEKIQSLVGGHHAWNDVYGLISLARSRFYSAAMHEALAGHVAYEDLKLPLDRMRRWHPLNQGLYVGMKIHVPGLLLQAKGDRAASSSALETRYPFLDEDVIALAAGLAPRWKLRRLRDKYLLRRVAERFLPAPIAWRPKRDFVAPFDSLYRESVPPYVEQLLSDESLRRTGYFDGAAVRLWRHQYRKLRRSGGKRLSVEVGLAGVVATQLWHHLFIDNTLADLPGSPGGTRLPSLPVASEAFSRM